MKHYQTLATADLGGKNLSSKVPLYIRRNVLNADELLAWAKEQGFTTTLPADEMHVTQMFSKAPVDWFALDWDFLPEGVAVAPNGERSVKGLGDEGAVVLRFDSSILADRWADLCERGCSWDHPEYQPHITISYNAAGLDLSKIEPYRGALMLGPEIFESIHNDWSDSIQENALAYSAIEQRLDELEAKARDSLRGALEESRDALMARVRRSSNLAELVRTLRKLPRFSGVSAELRAMLDRAWERGWKDARAEVRERKKEFAGTDSSFSPSGAARWLRAHAFWISGILGDRILADSKGVILNGLKTGKASAQIMDDLLAVFLPYLGDASTIKDDKQLEPYRLETIVRTNNTTAYNHGRLTAFIDKDVQPFLKGVKYSAILDTRTTDVCVTGETLVMPSGSLRKVSKRMYEGDVLIITTATGKQLEVTQNHPVLTARGWLPAKEIDPSKEVVYSTALNGLCVPCAQEVGVPPTAAELFDAVSNPTLSSSVLTKCSSADDFHGDGMGGNHKVNIAILERDLRLNVVAAFFDEVSNCLFRSVERTGNLDGLGALSLLLFGRTPVIQATQGKLGRAQGRVQPTFAMFDSLQDFCRPLASLKHSYSGFGVLRKVSGVPSNIFHDAEFLEQACYGGDRDVVLPCQRCGRNSVAVRSDNVVSVSREFRVCHVYNLETSSAFYHAGGLIIHNCRFLDGKIFKPGSPDLEALLPPNHYQCRSIVVPVVIGEKVNENQFITPAEIGRAKQLADPKFLTLDEHPIFSIWSWDSTRWQAYREEVEA